MSQAQTAASGAFKRQLSVDVKNPTHDEKVVEEVVEKEPQLTPTPTELDEQFEKALEDLQKEKS